MLVVGFATFVVWQSFKTKDPKRWKNTLVAGAGVAAFFLVPAVQYVTAVLVLIGIVWLFYDNVFRQ